MNQSVDGKGRAAINVHQAQLSPLQIAEGSHVGVNATGCKRPNAHTRPGKLDGKCPHEGRSEEHTSELQSLMRTSYAVFCLKKKPKLHPTKTLPIFTTNTHQIQTVITHHNTEQ